MSGGKGTSGRGDRKLFVRVKTARGRSVSSQNWLKRQLNDPYVQRAKDEGYRSRAAFKLLELDRQFHLLKKGARVVDLGAAPGGWTQVAAAKVGKTGKVIGIDITPVEPIPGAEIIAMDFLDDAAPDRLKEMLDGEADLVMSDMAAPATGHKPTDHLKIMALCEAALMFAREGLKPGGAFVAKVLQGGTERSLLEEMKRSFARVAHAKPPSSRADSAEMYVVATGFRRT